MTSARSLSIVPDQHDADRRPGAGAVLAWCDPPVGVWAGRLLPLKRRPGHWALVWTTASLSTASSTCSSLAKATRSEDHRCRGYAVPPGRWEFAAGDVRRSACAQLLGELDFGVWARYLEDAQD